MKAIISGGGTGGHIFPAIAIANALREKDPAAEILFVGAQGRMEMEKVPAAGYAIKGLEVVGFQRRLTWKNLLFPYKLWKSLRQARAIVRDFAPDVVVGVGGYASGPTLRVASQRGIPCLIQEQNSYPGITNKILSAKVQKICVAYEGLERFFPSQKIVMTGNPIRQDILSLQGKEQEAATFFGLDPHRPTLLVIGGSLGARTLNECLLRLLPEWEKSGWQLIWQTGKNFDTQRVDDHYAQHPSCRILPFITRMDLAYALATVIVSRAGALSISELCVVGKAAVLLPSPNVSEDHQTHNALSLVDRGAALLVTDADAEKELWGVIQKLMHDEALRTQLSQEILLLAKPRAAMTIAEEVLSLIPPAR